MKEKIKQKFEENESDNNIVTGLWVIIFKYKIISN